ncbi:MAG: class I SAM-dependent methyltransferase [Synechococcaceae cyanobacterium SM2_3_1]|nr:class I SAM-dependent methyltransferase [Synechococcaceae cyanobacterium SM2_3_1]
MSSQSPRKAPITDPETIKYQDHDTITEKVQKQYETYPYPNIPVDQPFTGFSPLHSYILAQYARTRRLHLPQGKKALVGGCGTGWELHAVAASNPGLATITGVDLSTRSLELARERIQRHNLSQCHVMQGDILNRDDLPDEWFDFICSYGVLHHTADPVLALCNLASRLASGGVMAVMLYNRTGRDYLHHLRQAITLLGVYDLPREQAIDYVRSLLNSATPGSPLHAHAQQLKQYYRDEEHIVDNFFPAQEADYSIADIPKLLEQANLAFLDIAPLEDYWQIERSISGINARFYDGFHRLSRIQQLLLIESLDPRRQTQNLFWCCHKDQQHEFENFTEEWFNQNSWQLNPVFLTHALIQDQNLSFRDYLDFQTQSNHHQSNCRIIWPFFHTTPQQISVFSERQIQILRIMAEHPQPGSVLLEKYQASTNTCGMRHFRQWEQDRVILKIGFASNGEAC